MPGWPSARRSVAYTHLDVYKRQMAVPLRRPVMVAVPSPLSKTCLLYTSVFSFLLVENCWDLDETCCHDFLESLTIQMEWGGFLSNRATD